MKNATKIIWKERFKVAFPYILATILIVTALFFGNFQSNNKTASLSVMDSVSNNNFTISADQLSEYYMIARFASSVSLASSDVVNNNFVSLDTFYEIASNADFVEKPNIIETGNLVRGIIEYVVQAGDTIPAIAKKYNITDTNIRHSNNLKNNTVSVGQKLYLPPVEGILYTVKSGDTVSSIADKYQSNAELITSYNDLETQKLTVGKTIILPGGVLPLKERPEYVPPSYNYNIPTASGGIRQNTKYIHDRQYWINETRRVGTGIAYAGNCTWYAWYHRTIIMGGKYSVTQVMGNGGQWANNARRQGFPVDHNPQVHDAVVTSTASASNPYGHVAIVVGVYNDGSIRIREMNWNWILYQVTESDIPAQYAKNFWYIHAKP